jgi:hypothetical protein
MSRNVHDLIGDISEMLDTVECEYINVSEDRDYLQRELKEFKEKDKEFPKAYELGFEEGFAKGEQSMQEKAKKIVDFWVETDMEVIENVFSDIEAYEDAFDDINKSYDKILEYEKKEKEIKVGDEVKDEYGEKYIVRKLDSRGIYLLRHNGEGVLDTGSNVSKTGKHYPLEEMLKELQ